MELISLFPVAVGSFDLPRPITAIENSYIEGLETRPNQTGNSISTNTYILLNESLYDLRDFFTNSIEEYVNSIYNPLTPLNIRITQSWANYTSPGQYHHKHQHFNSFISGVFYFKTNNATDVIHFYSDRYQQLDILPKEYNMYNSGRWRLPAIQGRLMLFPSHLTHTVPPISQDSDTRISISFNTFISGQIGENNKLTELFLPG